MPELYYFLFLILGDVGGVGKSTFCKTIVQYFLDKDYPFALFDSDRINPDIARVFKDICHLSIFSESNQLEEAANAIYNFAASQNVVVNCPAQVSPALNNWLVNNDILTFAKEDGITLYYWFVTNGQIDSIKVLRRSLQQFGSKIPHILVKNWGVNDNWQLLEGDEELQQLLQAHDVKVINFPRFHSIADYQKIDALSLSFGEAREYKDFSLITRNRVRSFLRQSYAEFDQIFPLENQSK